MTSTGASSRGSETGGDSIQEKLEIVPDEAILSEAHAEGEHTLNSTSVMSDDRVVQHNSAQSIGGSKKRKIEEISGDCTFQDHQEQVKFGTSCSSSSQDDGNYASLSQSGRSPK